MTCLVHRALTGDDVYGALLEDVLAGRPAFEIVERDDGFVSAHDARYLLARFRSWDDPVERRAMRFVRGHVLDVGCAAADAFAFTCSREDRPSSESTRRPERSPTYVAILDRT